MLLRGSFHENLALLEGWDVMVIYKVGHRFFLCVFIEGCARLRIELLRNSAFHAMSGWDTSMRCQGSAPSSATWPALGVFLCSDGEALVSSPHLHAQPYPSVGERRAYGVNNLGPLVLFLAQGVCRDTSGHRCRCGLLTSLLGC